MIRLVPLHTALAALLYLSLFLIGCGESDDASSSGSGDSGASRAAADGSSTTSPVSDRPEFKPITLGDSGSNANGGGQSARRVSTPEDVFAALKPLQVLLGTWRGLAKDQSGETAIDETKWVWDFTDKKQPALVLNSDNSAYFRKGRLTYIIADEKFRLTTELADSTERTFEGKYTEEPRDVPDENDENKLMRIFKLQLTQVAPGTGKKWQVIFNQRENNRYLMELGQERGNGSFRRFETVATQRQGTSFAISDSDYGEKTCIISEGLGTSTVNFEGKTYWVCCSGCKAAFEDEPEVWIAKLEKRKQAKMKK